MNFRTTALLLSMLMISACQDNSSRPNNSPHIDVFDKTLLKPEVLAMNEPKPVEPYADPDILKNLAPIRKSFGNLAVTAASEKINPRMTSYAAQVAKNMYEPVKGKVFLMSGWQLTATLIVVGDDGLIVVDPGENDESAAAIMKDFRETTGNKMPVKAAVFSHRHPDHSFGLRGMGVSQAMVDKGEVRIFAHHQFMEYLANDASVVGGILSQRTAYAASMYIGQNENGLVHAGLGPTFTAGSISFYRPTDLVKDTLEVEVAGVKMVLFEAYGDAEDEVDVYFPGLRHVYGSETIQGETFPNMYTLRGTKFRDPVKWYKGIDRLLHYASMSDSYSHAHMRAWVGTDFIVERIRNYRDAIQFVHDQAIRHMNNGATMEELVELVVLPEQLQNDPWLVEFYGSVAHSVRNIYTGYLGWYQGDATVLAAPAYLRKAKLYISALGGRQRVLELAQVAIDKEDYGWAMELLTHLVRVDRDDKDARHLKAKAMREWGYDQANIYWRGFALSGAAELDGSMNTAKRFEFGDPAIISQFSVGTILENMRVNIVADKAMNGDFKITFNITDRREHYAYHVRNGIAAFYESTIEDSDVVLNIPSEVIYDFVLGRASIKTALENGKGNIQGNIDDLDKFSSYFDFSKEPVRITVR